MTRLIRSARGRRRAATGYSCVTSCRAAASTASRARVGLQLLDRRRVHLLQHPLVQLVDGLEPVVAVDRRLRVRASIELSSQLPCRLHRHRVWSHCLRLGRSRPRAPLEPVERLAARCSERPPAITVARSARLRAATDCGAETTIGWPRCVPCRTFLSYGICQNTSRCSASCTRLRAARRRPARWRSSRCARAPAETRALRARASPRGCRARSRTPSSSPRGRSSRSRPPSPTARSACPTCRARPCRSTSPSSSIDAAHIVGRDLPPLEHRRARRARPGPSSRAAPRSRRRSSRSIVSMSRTRSTSVRSGFTSSIAVDVAEAVVEVDDHGRRALLRAARPPGSSRSSTCRCRPSRRRP